MAGLASASPRSAWAVGTWGSATSTSGSASGSFAPPWIAAELQKQNIGVLGMKSLANDQILKSGTVTALECLHYALNPPTSVVITGVESMERLEQAIETATNPEWLGEERQVLPE